MELQLTGLTTIVGVIIMLGAWRFVSARSAKSTVPTIKPVRLMSQFFLYMAIFFAFMYLPHISLIIAPWVFAPLMAWGYVIGHFFLYIALLYIARMTFAMIPRLAGKERPLIVLWMLAAVTVTIVNTVTMVFGSQPFYDYERHLTQVNAAPVVGISIAVFATLALLPAAILFIVNAVKTSGARRLRSALLGAGFLLQMSAGPLHDVARTWQTYMVADIFTILSVIIVGAGVVYRLDQSLAPTPQPASPSPAGSGV
jgi:hypothetical protein